MTLALLVCGLVVALVLVGLFVFGLRRRLIQRSGGTFDCSLRWGLPETPWMSGVEGSMMSTLGPRSPPPGSVGPPSPSL
ncbi:hypothetical protein ABZ726_15385, partial [Streptomyces hundungensis]